VVYWLKKVRALIKTRSCEKGLPEIVVCDISKFMNATNTERMSIICLLHRNRIKLHINFSMRSMPFFLLTAILSSQLMAQTTDSAYAAPYFLPGPNGWTSEVIPFPIEFAPSINYSGVEDLRFTAGWGDVKSEDYWSYAFLWWLEGSPEMNENVISNNLKAYYTGLVGRNIKPRNIPENKLVPIQITVKAIPVAGNDLQSFEGSVYMLDYMSQKPITLNFHVHIKKCAEAKRTVVFHEISPKPFDHAVWTRLDEIWSGFKCSK